MEAAGGRRDADLRQAGHERALETRALRRGAAGDPRGAAVSVAAAATAIAILNPEAGHGKGRRLATELAKVFRDVGMRIEVLVTPAPSEAARLAAEAADDGYPTVIAAGGDGTANEVEIGRAHV